MNEVNKTDRLGNSKSNSYVLSVFIFLIALFFLLGIIVLIVFIYTKLPFDPAKIFSKNNIPDNPIIALALTAIFAIITIVTIIELGNSQNLLTLLLIRVFDICYRVAHQIITGQKLEKPPSVTPIKETNKKGVVVLGMLCIVFICVFAMTLESDIFKVLLPTILNPSNPATPVPFSSPLQSPFSAP